MKNWCMGKKGREHTIELVEAPKVPGWNRKGCRWSCWEVAGKRFWLCNHVWICTSCGKHIKATHMADCPDYRPYDGPETAF